MEPRRDEIALRAYLIWEREGRPDGRALDHWLRAEAELAAEGAKAAPSAPKPKTRRPRGGRR